MVTENLYGLRYRVEGKEYYGELKGISVEDVTQAHAERQDIAVQDILSVKVIPGYSWPPKLRNKKKLVKKLVGKE